MKPKRIILIRHGESEGNVNKHIFKTLPDYALVLSDKGKQQAIEAGQKLKEIVKDDSVFFYVSPMWRTRITFENIVKSLKGNKIEWIEEPRIREQEFGHFRSDEEYQKIREESDKFGHFYYRILHGESGADVYDRVSDFFGTLHRDFGKENYQQNAVIVTHGLAMRLFLMKWYHLTVEQFEELDNPSNCEIIIMELQENGKYKLNADLKKKEVVHKYQRPIRIK